MNYHSISLADRIFEKLEDDIIQGVIPTKDIITEVRIADSLGVSRTPIREAFRRLEQESLIRDIGKGYLVLGITKENLIDIMDIRILLEPLASFYAAKNITPDGIKKLKDILDLQEFYSGKQDIDRLREEDEVFHDAICELSGRTVIAETLLPLHRKTRMYRRLSIENNIRRSSSLEEHKQIFKAISSSDCELAAELTAEHVKRAKKNMEERLGYNG